MKALPYLTAILGNLFALTIFLGMLYVTSTDFEALVISGLGLIYVAVISA